MGWEWRADRNAPAGSQARAGSHGAQWQDGGGNRRPDSSNSRGSGKRRSKSRNHNRGPYIRCSNVACDNWMWQDRLKSGPKCCSLCGVWFEATGAEAAAPDGVATADRAAPAPAAAPAGPKGGEAELRALLQALQKEGNDDAVHLIQARFPRLIEGKQPTAASPQQGLQWASRKVEQLVRRKEEALTKYVKLQAEQDVLIHELAVLEEELVDAEAERGRIKQEVLGEKPAGEADVASISADDMRWARTEKAINEFKGRIADDMVAEAHQKARAADDTMRQVIAALQQKATPPPPAAAGNAAAPADGSAAAGASAGAAASAPAAVGSVATPTLVSTDTKTGAGASSSGKPSAPAGRSAKDAAVVAEALEKSKARREALKVAREKEGGDKASVRIAEPPEEEKQNMEEG